MDDLISRQQAIATADSTDYLGLAIEDVKKVTDEVVKGLKQLPSAQPERKKGKWIDCNWSIRCSECDYSMPWAVRNFCPNCGARMEGANE